MWGIRAIRVGVMLGGLLAATASTGCFECCKNLCGGKTTLPANSSPELQDTEGLRTVEGDWKRGGGWFKDQPTSEPTPERVHGGIY
jgi:hypothetical protein